MPPHLKNGEQNSEYFDFLITSLCLKSTFGVYLLNRLEYIHETSQKHIVMNKKDYSHYIIHSYHCQKFVLTPKPY